MGRVITFLSLVAFAGIPACAAPPQPPKQELPPVKESAVESYQGEARWWLGRIEFVPNEEWRVHWITVRKNRAAVGFERDGVKWTVQFEDQGFEQVFLDATLREPFKKEFETRDQLSKHYKTELAAVDAAVRSPPSDATESERQRREALRAGFLGPFGTLGEYRLASASFVLHGRSYFNRHADNLRFQAMIFDLDGKCIGQLMIVRWGVGRKTFEEFYRDFEDMVARVRLAPEEK